MYITPTSYYKFSNSTHYSSIVGSFCNTIDANETYSNCYSVIGGGFCNCICANTCFSSILGGQGNCVLHNWASASGYNVVTNQDCAFHANGFVAQNMPIWATCPGGTLEYLVPTAGLIAAGIPASACIVLIH